MEVERDQVVDRNAGQLLHGVERALRRRSRPRGVDPVGRDADVGVAVDRHVEVAREREQRERVLLRVGADQHQRVRARVLRAEALVAGALVVADDERGRGLRTAAGTVARSFCASSPAAVCGPIAFSVSWP